MFVLRGTDVTRGLSRDRVDAIAATVLSHAPRRPRRGPNGLKLEKETTHDIVSVK